jgi:carbonic anhydrase
VRLLEAIIDANHRALAGDQNAGLHPADFADELPLVALTCIDPRLNRLLPSVLGVPEEQFIWLRAAGNIITDPVGAMMRSLALGCAVKGGKEIAIIGHTDCRVSTTSAMELIDRLRALGVERHMLPDNLNEFFGLFASERTNVIKGVEIVRRSPLVGPKIPVHGLLVDIETGKLEWLVNGYQTVGTMDSRWTEVVKSAGQTVDALKSLAEFKIGEMKFPEGKIGETVTRAEDWLAQKVPPMGVKPPASVPPPMPSAPTGAPRPPVIRARMHLRKGRPDIRPPAPSDL